MGKRLTVNKYVFSHRWIGGDATDLPFDDCEFDAITMGYGLRNVVDRDRAMREMYRVLKPGSIHCICIQKLCAICLVVFCLVIRLESVHT